MPFTPIYVSKEVTADEFNRIMNQLVSIIAELEARIAKLEAQNGN